MLGSMSNSLKIKLLWGSFFLIFIWSFTIGRFPIQVSEVVQAFLGRFLILEDNVLPEVQTVIFQVRLPRIVSSVLIGASLSVAGATYQGLFRNPMVSPEVLGASSGAGFGAALGILLSFSYIGITMIAFIFGLMAVTIAYIISIRSTLDRTLSMVLAGIMVGSVFSALISFVKYVADPQNTLPAITYWLMGSLASIRQKDVLFITPPILMGLIPLVSMRWRLNLLTWLERGRKDNIISNDFRINKADQG